MYNPVVVICTLSVLASCALAEITSLRNCSRTEMTQGGISVIEITCSGLDSTTITRPLISSLLHESTRHLEGKDQIGARQEVLITKSYNLKLEDLSVDKISDGSFTDATELKTLNMRGNAITELKPQSMAGLRNVQNLKLDSNNIATIAPATFNGLMKLEWLNLAWNRISEISYFTFMGLNKLKSLNLEYNNISSIQTAAFGALWQLDNLYLEGNRISSISSGSLAGLYNLKFLSLKRNELSEVADGTFGGNPQITFLDLSYNRIGEIKSSTFVGLTGLRNLKLNGNSISLIKDRAFTYVPQLSELDLSHNALTTLRRKMFLGLENIHVLDISENWMHGTAMSTDKSYGSDKYNLIESIGIICRKPGLYFTNLRNNGLIPMLSNITAQQLGFDYTDHSQHFCVF